MQTFHIRKYSIILIFCHNYYVYPQNQHYMTVIIKFCVYSIVDDLQNQYKPCSARTRHQDDTKTDIATGGGGGGGGGGVVVYINY